MLMIHEAKVYRLDADTIDKLAEDRQCQKFHDDVNDNIRAFAMEIEDDCISEMEFTLRLRAARLSNDPLRAAVDATMNFIWDTFVKTHNGDVSAFLVDMKPDDVKNHVHNEPGVGYDLDNAMTIDCAGCQIKTDAYLEWVKIAKTLRDIDPNDITEDMILEVMNAAPDLGVDGPPLGMAIQTDKGLIVIGVQFNDGPDFDEAQPEPTHSGSRSLN